ncbi:MAG TPA: squalene synthase HpnC [Nocardioides sp.]|uniref:squalene synthase HpnC n=1 Tax=Nocardioides sp. TaxID=35761 RepID=UPI002E316A3A|nr:squalene synthase HpnC [Nocardioides sp.]HEX5087647.1 squalene synthase HpnC [Nocardioides sp.]
MVVSARSRAGRDEARLALDRFERQENFPVALRVLPARYRRDLRALYAFARTVDELGDSAAGDRTVQLQELDAELSRIWTGGAVTDPVLAGLAITVRAHDLPAKPFHDLVAANLMDQTVNRYETFEELRGYCRLSADPVGRLVLGVFDQASDALTLALSDRVCTALQLLEHWQDVGEDRRAGRIYLPQEDLRRHGVPETDLDAASASPALRALVREEVEQAAELLESGAGIVDRVQGWARPCVAGFVAGGRATAAALRRTDGDVLARSARASRPGTAARLVVLLGRSLVGRPR